MLIGREAERVANTSYVAFPELEGTVLVQLLDLKGLSTSTGAACKAGSDDHSHVLLAQGIPETLARGAVRFSLGHETSVEEVSEAVERIAEAVEEIGAG